MPKWVLICSKCKNEFEHSQIPDVGLAWLLLAEKPPFAPTGNDYVCPNCGYGATYFRTNLLYRDSKAGAEGLMRLVAPKFVEKGLYAAMGARRLRRTPATTSAMPRPIPASVIINVLGSGTA